MPLIKSGSDAAFKTNVRTLMHDIGKSPHVQSQKQALAIAYATKRRGRDDGGRIDPVPLPRPDPRGPPIKIGGGDRDRPPKPAWNVDWGPAGKYKFTNGGKIAGRDEGGPVTPLTDEELAYLRSPERRVLDTQSSQQLDLGNPDIRVGMQPPVNPRIMPDGTVRGFGGGGKIAGFAAGGTAPWFVRSEARNMTHSGPIASTVPGRTDKHNVNVRSGAYVLPADVVSHVGQSNTAAGHAKLSSFFSGPYGTSAGKLPSARPPGLGLPKPTLPKATLPKPSFGSMAKPPQMKFGKMGAADGGAQGDDGTPVPIVVAGGEFTVPREAVLKLGGGDLQRGHNILDCLTMLVRKDQIKTLQKLPPPAKK